MGDLIAVGACSGPVVVCMTLSPGQTPVGFAMARDALFEAPLAKTHPCFGTPYRSTLLAAIPIGLLATFVPLSTLAELVNIGILAAFVLVSVGAMVLRRTRPDLPRSFKMPWVPIGFIVCFAYSRRHSRLNRPRTAP